MTFSGDLGNWFDGHERHAELLGAHGEVVDHALAVTLLEIVLAGLPRCRVPHCHARAVCATSFFETVCGEGGPIT